jgi:hypothetical protein
VTPISGHSSTTCAVGYRARRRVWQIGLRDTATGIDVRSVGDAPFGAITGPRGVTAAREIGMTKRAQFVPGRPGVRAATGQFFVDIEVRAQPHDSAPRQLRALVDLESRYTWLSAAMLEDMGIMRRQPIWFTTESGEQVSRLAGYAYITVDGQQTVDTVIFAEKNDPTILGAHSVDGLNMTPEPSAKRLAPAGPLPVPKNFVAP